jgi:hypothetical protein
MWFFFNLLGRGDVAAGSGDVGGEERDGGSIGGDKGK